MYRRVCCVKCTDKIRLQMRAFCMAPRVDLIVQRFLPNVPAVAQRAQRSGVPLRIYSSSIASLAALVGCRLQDTESGNTRMRGPFFVRPSLVKDYFCYQSLFYESVLASHLHSA